jgi:hypothetical protein
MTTLKPLKPNSYEVMDGATVLGTVRRVTVRQLGRDVLRWKTAAPGQAESEVNHVTQQGAIDSLKPKPQSPRRSPALVSVVFKLQRTSRDAVDQLATETRVRKSEYLREAIADLLAKHAEELDGTP